MPRYMRFVTILCATWFLSFQAPGSKDQLHTWVQRRQHLSTMRHEFFSYLYLQHFNRLCAFAMGVDPHRGWFLTDQHGHIHPDTVEQECQGATISAPHGLRTLDLMAGTSPAPARLLYYPCSLQTFLLFFTCNPHLPRYPFQVRGGPPLLHLAPANLFLQVLEVLVPASVMLASSDPPITGLWNVGIPRRRPLPLTTLQRNLCMHDVKLPPMRCSTPTTFLTSASK